MVADKSGSNFMGFLYVSNSYFEKKYMLIHILGTLVNDENELSH
jgi:hypothetical protein